MDRLVTTIQTCCDIVDSELERDLHYTENNYQNALLHTLRNKFPSNYILGREVPLVYKLSDGFIFGAGRIDILVETPEFVLILELKAQVDCKYLKKFSSQTLRYVKHYNTDKPKRGMCIIFGSCSPILKLLP